MKSYDKWDQGKTVAWKLFHWTWECTVPKIHLINPVLLEQYGTFHSQDPSVMNSMAGENWTTMLTIPKIAKLIYDGVEVTFHKTEHLPIVYELIYDHLLEWQHHMTLTVTVEKAPIADLEILDNMAAIIYPKACAAAGGHLRDPSNVLGSLVNLKRNRLTHKHTETVAIDPHKPIDDQVIAPKHNSILDSLINTAYARNQNGN